MKEDVEVRHTARGRRRRYLAAIGLFAFSAVFCVHPRANSLGLLGWVVNNCSGQTGSSTYIFARVSGLRSMENRRLAVKVA